MGTPKRLQTIKRLHRRRQRAQGVMPYLGQVERIEIDHALANKEDPDDVARRYGITRKQVMNTHRNRAVWSGLSYSELALTSVQRKAALNVPD